jgi:hypothetical protein
VPWCGVGVAAEKGRNPAKQRRLADSLGDCDADLRYILSLAIDSELARNVSCA